MKHPSCHTPPRHAIHSLTIFSSVYTHQSLSSLSNFINHNQTSTLSPCKPTDLTELTRPLGAPTTAPPSPRRWRRWPRAAWRSSHRPRASSPRTAASGVGFWRFWSAWGQVAGGVGAGSVWFSVVLRGSVAWREPVGWMSADIEKS